MDQASDDMRQQRLAHLRSGRAADELLIAAIFGDVLFGRAPGGVDHGLPLCEPVRANTAPALPETL